MTLRIRHILLTALPLALAACAGMSGSLDGPVRTDKGLVSGAPSEVADGVRVFKGVPFGAPPVGELRWRPAQPAAAWEGVRDATEWGPVCHQPESRERPIPNRTLSEPGSPPVSEDCLYLNVWTPATRADERLPVMVWVFGGAYYEGGGSTPHNRGDYLAQKGVVVVTFNYRLGPLGFMAHPELTAESEHGASGNYALTDALAALDWVQRNIAAFGGDPDNVTIFGESAGSAITAALVGSPQAEGLFHKAIAESGTWMGLTMAPMIPLATAEQRGVQAAEDVGRPTLAELRAMPAAEASERLPRQGMIIDGWVIPEDLSITFAEGRQNKVDVIAGSNRDESSFFGGQQVTAESWRAGAAQRWGDLAELGLAAYPATTDEEAREHAAKIGLTDNMAWSMRLMAQRQREIGRRAYVYHFVQEPPYAEGVRNIGVCHACEIPYVFNNLGTPRVIPDQSSPEMALADPVHVQAADITSSYWTNFAKTGDPNGPGLPEWPLFESIENGPVLELDATPEVGDSLGPAKVALYNALYERQMAELGVE